MPFRDPTIDPVKRCGGAVEADGWNYTKDRRVRWKVNKDDSVRYQSNHGGKRYKNVKKASGERAKAKDADSAGKKKKKKKEESDDDVEDKAEEEEEDEEEELYENPDHRDARETIEVDLQTWNGEDFANAVKSQAYLELDEVRFLRTSPITYAVCSQITEEDAPAVNQRLMKEVEPDHPRRREFLRDLTTVPAGKRADRPYHGDKPYLVKALTYQLCQDKFWPDNEYKQVRSVTFVHTLTCLVAIRQVHAPGHT